MESPIGLGDHNCSRLATLHGAGVSGAGTGSGPRAKDRQRHGGNQHQQAPAEATVTATLTWPTPMVGHSASGTCSACGQMGLVEGRRQPRSRGLIQGGEDAVEVPLVVTAASWP
jgi:hypothetical protein